MKYKVGFIGCGNMGGALASAIAEKCGAKNLAVCDTDAQKLANYCQKHGTVPTTSADVAQNAEFVFLAVKPQTLPSLLPSLADVLSRRNDVTLVSMAAGVTVETIRGALGFPCPVIRIMPNTSCAVGEGMIVYTSEGVCEEKCAEFVELISLAGKTDRLDESKFDVATAVMGCGPAFAYVFIEALADAGVAGGLTREQANLYAAQMLLGAGKTALANGGHPADLKDAVCSPAGSTVAGVHALEQNGFRWAVISAVNAAKCRNEELKKGR